ncbi:MAG TPA: SufD family Fe-S cluster assembly protein, partial [Tepiditoga sp.]|nr:SufD family Fe-S cluster assembly protein [Tepiditoga sp.]
MQIERDHSKEFEKISEAYEKSGGDVSNLLSKDIVSIIVSGNQVIGRNTVEGVDIKADVKDNTVVLYLDI